MREILTRSSLGSPADFYVFFIFLVFTVIVYFGFGEFAGYLKLEPSSEAML